MSLKLLPILLLFVWTASTAPAQNMPTLKVGSKGEDVLFLQQQLNDTLKLPTPIGEDGDFGGGTKTAVEAFQTSRFLGADGIVGKWTWIALLEKIPEGAKVGVKGERVAMLQEILNTTVAPSPPLVADGDFGSGTKSAVVKFQTAQGITPVTGEVGVKTWRKLLELAEQKIPSVPQTGQTKPLAFADVDFWKKVDAELAANAGLAAFHDGAIRFVVMNDTFKMEAFLRDDTKTFTETIKTDPNPFLVAVNGAQYEFTKGYYGVLGPRKLAGTLNQGLIYAAGKSVHTSLTRPAKSMFFVANTPAAVKKYQFGFLDPGKAVSGNHNSLGGLGPIIINGLQYANRNKYKAGASGPATGDPGPALSSKLLQRSNATFKNLNGLGDEVGKTIIAHHGNRKLVLLIVQEHGVKGQTLEAIRDILVGLGVDNAAFLDGSSSSTLALGKEIAVSPTFYKNNSNPVGVGFRK